MATKQKIPTGSKVKFLGYSEDDADGPLLDSTGVELEVTGFDKEDETYNVKGEVDDESIVDSLYDDEFEVTEVEKPATKTATKKTATKKAATKKTATKKAATKKTATKKTAKVKEEQEEETPPATKTAKKKTATKQAKKNEEETDVLPFKKTTTITSTLKEYGGDAVAAAYDWVEEVEKSNFVLGGLLAYIKRNDSQNEIESEEVSAETGEVVASYVKGLKGFNAFVEDYLSIKAVKAHWLVRIYETFSQVSTEKEIAAVGWTKLRELLPLGDLITKENVGEWLQKANDETTADLHEEVKKKLVQSGTQQHGNKNTNEQTTRKFVFFNHQAEVIEEAIEKKKAELDDATKGDYPDSAALYAIISEWSDLQEQEG